LTALAANPHGLKPTTDFRAPDIIDRLRSVTSLVTWFFLVFPDISLHVVTPGAVKIDAR
jgi:hypothetical protein